MDGGSGTPSAVPEGIILSSRVSEELYAYWRHLALCRGGVPRREDFDPAEVPALLPNLFIVEKDADTGRYLFRLSGTGIRDIMGTGKHAPLSRRAAFRRGSAIRLGDVRTGHE